MKKNVSKLFLLSLLAAVVFTGCGNSNSGTSESDTTEKTKVTIGVTAISNVTYEAIKEDFEDMGYETETVMFDANPVVLEAANSKQIDIALGQHLKFVQSFNQNNSGNLDMAKPYGYYTGIGLYSEKHTSIADIPDGAQIAIMNDAMNMDIALNILQDNGLLKLRDDVDLYTIADIIENPKNIKVIDVEQGQTVTALQDMDAACIFFTHMANAGKDPASYLARDTQMIKYPMGVIVRAENVEAPWAVDFAKCFKNDNVQEEINAAFPGVFEFYTSDAQAE